MTDAASVVVPWAGTRRPQARPDRSPGLPRARGAPARSVTGRGARGVTRLAHITALDRVGVATVLAIRPNGATLSSAGGKGLDRCSASVSACMEALELHHAETASLASLCAPYTAVGPGTGGDGRRGSAAPRAAPARQGIAIP